MVKENKKYLSNKMQENINIIDNLVENGFMINDSVYEPTLSDPDGVPINLWSWLPIWGGSAIGKYIDEYKHKKFPNFSWLACFFPIACIWKIKNWGFFKIALILNYSYEITLAIIKFELFDNPFGGEFGRTGARIGIFFTIFYYGCHVVFGRLYPYLVWSSLNNKIKHNSISSCYILVLILFLITSLFVPLFENVF